MNPLHLELTLDEVNLILEALGEQPYVRVHGLIASIHQQATAQLREGSPHPEPTLSGEPPRSSP